MSVSTRDQRALAALGAALLVGAAIYRFGSPAGSANIVAPVGNPITAAETRLARLREIAATVPAKESILKQVSAEGAIREKGVVKADTAAQAQAQLLQLIRELSAAETPPVDIRATELNGIRPLGDAYGEAIVSVQIECRIDQLLNLLAGLQARPELIASREIRVLSSNAKEKTVTARLMVSGVVPRRLVPEKAKTGGTTF